MKKILVSALAVVALSTSAMATVNSQTGCGLGSVTKLLVLHQEL